MNWDEEDHPEEKIHHWTLQDDVKTKYQFEIGYPNINLLSEGIENRSDIFHFDLKQVEYIRDNIDEYLTKAIAHLKLELSKNPEMFGIDADKVGDYVNLPDEQFPVDLPGLIFYPDRTWIIRFADADFPVIDYRFGIAVYFDKNNEIEGFDILQEEE